MTRQSVAYVRWYEEEVGGGGERRAKAAWLVRDVADMFGERQQVLAYLGQRPTISPMLEEELRALYPDTAFDWPAIGRALAAVPGYTNVAALTDDELVLGLRALVRERGLSLMDFSLRLGYRQRQVLPELMALLERPENVARYERTSGSVYDYMAARHPEYAYLIVKARLFLERDEERLQATIRAEPDGYGDEAWRARRQHWRAQIDAHERERRPPPAAPSGL
jgi:hypothetical protein